MIGPQMKKQIPSGSRSIMGPTPTQPGEIGGMPVPSTGGSPTFPSMPGGMQKQGGMGMFGNRLMQALARLRAKIPQIGTLGGQKDPNIGHITPFSGPGWDYNKTTGERMEAQPGMSYFGGSPTFDESAGFGIPEKPIGGVGPSQEMLQRKIPAAQKMRKYGGY